MPTPAGVTAALIDDGRVRGRSITERAGMMIRKNAK
jgi:hypothetical protein